MQRTFFITGADTGAGKTVLTALLAGHLHRGGERVAALKPLCSGGRADAVALQAALGGALTLDEINPWHFRAPISPRLAAQREKRAVTRAEVLAFIRATRKKFAVTLVEGAGGLLSPLGEDFDSRDLLVALRATPLIAAQNRLGMVNHVLLTLAALPKPFRARAKVVLMSPERPDSATKDNARLLGEFFPAANLFRLPWLGKNPTSEASNPSVRRTLEALMG